MKTAVELSVAVFDGPALYLCSFTEFRVDDVDADDDNLVTFHTSDTADALNRQQH